MLNDRTVHLCDYIENGKWILVGKHIVCLGQEIVLSDKKMLINWCNWYNYVVFGILTIIDNMINDLFLIYL